MNRDYDKARDMHEQAMENVFAKVDVAKAYMEQLSIEMEGAIDDVDKWRRLDRLLSKARISLDGL